MMKLLKQDRWLISCLLAVLLGFFGFLIWATFAPLAVGVTAAGRIVVQSDIQTVQHLEGGTIKEILVSNGDTVTTGQVLVKLDSLNSELNRSYLQKELANTSAEIDRLNALLNGKSELSFPSRADWLVDMATANQIARDQLATFNAQLTTHQEELNVLSSRKRKLLSSRRTRIDEINLVEAETQQLLQELTAQEDLYEKGLTTIPRISELRSRKSTLEARLASLKSRNTEIAAEITEIDKQSQAVSANFLSQTRLALLEAKRENDAASHKLAEINEQLTRTEIKAPMSGKVHDIRFPTIGAVIMPSQPIMDIVPTTSIVFANVRLPPKDRESTHENMQVSVQLEGLRSWEATRIEASIITISPELKTDEVTKSDYYEVRLRLSIDAIPEAQKDSLFPGMPVIAFFEADKKMTVLEYITDPLRKQLSTLPY